MIKFENPSNGRFYYLKVQKDLINDLVLCVIYGGRNITRLRTIKCGTPDKLYAEIGRLHKKRIARGYLLIT